MNVLHETHYLKTVLVRFLLKEIRVELQQAFHYLLYRENRLLAWFVIQALNDYLNQNTVFYLLNIA